MAIRTNWLVQDRVILSQAKGDISEDEFVNFIADLQAFTQNLPEGTIVHLIQDARLIGKPYSNMGKISKFLNVLRRIKGWYLVVNKPGNRFFEFLAHFAGQIVGVRMRPTYEHYAPLREFLMDQYPDLDMPETLPDYFEQLDPAGAH
jgi:hypothetical protein